MDILLIKIMEIFSKSDIINAFWIGWNKGLF